MVSAKTPIVRARDIMHKGVVYIDGMDTAKEAAATMRDAHVSALLVKKRHPDDAWGIIVVQDLIRGVLIPWPAFFTMPAYGELRLKIKGNLSAWFPCHL
jgi:CBS domain-containing protein